MTVRARRPTDEDGTGVYDPGRDPERRRALRGGSPGDRVAGASASPETWDHDATELTPLPGAPPVEQATPTHVDPRRPERSEPIRVISMKDRTEGDRPRRDEPRVPLHVQLRSMAEVAGLRDPPSGLGRLAPPRDPAQARRRRHRDNAVWACVAIVLALGISLAIWLVAGR